MQSFMISMIMYVKTHNLKGSYIMDNNVKRNVTLNNEKKYFPCPICKLNKEVEMTRKGKPYLTCNDCGVQLFVRGQKGIRKLVKLFERENNLECITVI